MAEQNINLPGTRVETLYSTIEKGVDESGNEYEKKQAIAPRTYEEAITDQNKVPLSQKIANILEKISQLDGGEYDTLLQEIEDIKREIAGLDLKQWDYIVPKEQKIIFDDQTNPRWLGIDESKYFYLQQNDYKVLIVRPDNNFIDTYGNLVAHNHWSLPKNQRLYIGAETPVNTFCQLMTSEGFFRLIYFNASGAVVQSFRVNIDGTISLENIMGAKLGTDAENNSVGGIVFNDNVRGGNTFKIVENSSDGNLVICRNTVQNINRFEEVARFGLNKKMSLYGDFENLGFIKNPLIKPGDIIEFGETKDNALAYIQMNLTSSGNFYSWNFVTKNGDFYDDTFYITVDRIVHFKHGITAPNIASATMELLSAQRDITEVDLQDIETQRMLTEQEISSIETQQTLTDMELMIIGGQVA